MYNPVSTYRIQFHKAFTLSHLEAIIPYLEELEISTIYASPLFKAVPGSMHGYDGIDPTQINPEIGTLDQLRQVAMKLKAKGIGWIQDIVPNHLAFHSDNAWLMDVLEHGPDSKYAAYFDIDLSQRIMVPFLGTDLAQVIENGELQIKLQGGKLQFVYGEHSWPLNPASYVQQDLAKVNRDKALLQQIADQQYYRLCSWQETNHTINYRRFFTVNGLICLNIQRPEVFETFHQIIAELVKEKVFDGLRIDHIDGLYDPATYLRKLRELTGPDTYIVVEKILEPGEAMPEWPVEGNTGYDFLAMVNNLLTKRTGEAELATYYRQQTHSININEAVSQKKRKILTTYMNGEWDNLTQLFLELKLAEISFEELKPAIGELLVACPVYRFYGNAFPLAREEAEALRRLFISLKAAHKKLVPAINQLEQALQHKRALPFYQRLMQFTGPLMAKGVEDTLMYTDNHFIAHNEVGDSPAAMGVSVTEFHQMMKERQHCWPLSLNATATHDTKRGEDVRARLQVLPDLAAEWLELVRSWQKQAPTHISANDAYFIYQTLLGAYPGAGAKNDDFAARLNAYLEKTLREGKENSDWAEPNLEYETAAKDFAAQLLNPQQPFWKTFEPFYAKVADFGIVNSLAQVLLKFACPGVPDVYQGCEHWDFSLVDPDNRRPVDFKSRTKLLSGLENTAIKDLWKNRQNGEIKVWLTALLAAERGQQAALFSTSEYVPLQIEGKYKKQVIAFARQLKNTWYIVAVPLGLASLINNLNDLMDFDWADTRIVLPEDFPANAANLLVNQNFSTNGEVNISTLFEILPLAFLKLQSPENLRGAGVLLPLASLPSPYGIGDLGPEARHFADLLHTCGQKYWQLLPLSPVSAAQQYSPYSAYSSFAGNEWFISPQLLADEGLLELKKLKKFTIPATDKIDYKQAGRIKQRVLATAWKSYTAGNSPHLRESFREFCIQENYWLDDYALYVTLRRHNDDAPWYQWPKPYKNRQVSALKKFSREQATNLEKAKWLQFLFARQLDSFKTHCNSLDIKLFGDLPFYVSYDSADVWANPELFSLDKNGQLVAVAGVPPDYFNADGQLWGMPVFNWERLRARNFDWWILRIKKNLQYFDLLRLDHFRAFSSYWSVAASETTAINGKWVQAPGANFFAALQAALGELPLVAEDLGDIDEAVYNLRDQFSLPGMKVLQFAWGEDQPVSPHMPHNYTTNFVAYTGTHDNNTTKGWYRHEVDKSTRKRLSAYMGTKLKSADVAPALIRLALASVARLAIIPLQDWLGLDQKARLNTPAALTDNWVWRVNIEDLKNLPRKKIKQLTELYNR